jgi:DNA-binding protein HU-beta
MRQSELISTIAERTTIGKGQVTRMLDTLVEVCRDELIADGAVQLKGIGRFSTKLKAARTGRNPRTGDPVQIAARRRVAFKMAPSLGHELNPPLPAAHGRRRA